MCSPISKKRKTCSTRSDSMDYGTKASTCAGERSTLALRKTHGLHEIQNWGNLWPHQMGLGPAKLKILNKEQFYPLKYPN